MSVNAFDVCETILLCDVITTFYESIKLAQFSGIVLREQELFTVLVLADNLLLRFGSFAIVSFFFLSFLLVQCFSIYFSPLPINFNHVSINFSHYRSNFILCRPILVMCRPKIVMSTNFIFIGKYM